MYQQLSFIEQEVSSLNKPIDYEIKSLLQTNKKLYKKRSLKKHDRNESRSKSNHRSG